MEIDSRGVEWMWILKYKSNSDKFSDKKSAFTDISKFSVKGFVFKFFKVETNELKLKKAEIYGNTKSEITFEPVVRKGQPVAHLKAVIKDYNFVRNDIGWNREGTKIEMLKDIFVQNKKKIVWVSEKLVEWNRVKCVRKKKVFKDGLNWL